MLATDQSQPVWKAATIRFGSRRCFAPEAPYHTEWPVQTLDKKKAQRQRSFYVSHGRDSSTLITGPINILSVLCSSDHATLGLVAKVI
jgi:hypothetical protein